MHFKVAGKEVVTRRGKHSFYEGVQCMYCGCKMNWEVTLHGVALCN